MKYEDYEEDYGPVNIYKLDVYIIDHDECGADEIKTVIENQRYPNRCTSPHVDTIKEFQIPSWNESHPLNKRGSEELMRSIFAPTSV